MRVSLEILVHGAVQLMVVVIDCFRACTGVENIKVEPVVMEPAGSLVMGACTRCLMYVMLSEVNPMCPRCESKIPVDFNTATLPRKKHRGENRRK